MRLTAEQERAAATVDRDVGILAAAGSGKTTVLCAHYEALIRHAKESPRRILAFTFTDKAATELKERLEASLGHSDDPHLLQQFWSEAWIGTIHHFCARVCRQNAHRIGLFPQFEIIEGELSLSCYSGLVADVIRSETSGDAETLRAYYGLDNLHKLLLRLRTDPLAPEHFPRDALGQALLHLHRRVEAAFGDLKSRLRVLDFDDLERLAIEILDSCDDVRAHYGRLFRHILVDEFQDLSAAQGRLIGLLWHPGKNRLFFVGDPKQAIYGFRGGDVEVFYRFWERLKYEGGAQFVLRENWRSAPRLVDFTNALFTPLWQSDRIPYVPMTALKETTDGKVCHRLLDEAARASPRTSIDARRREEAEKIAEALLELSATGLPWHEMAVLARSSRFFEHLAPELEIRSIPYDIHKSRMLMEEPFAVVLGTLLLYVLDPRDPAARIGFLRLPVANTRLLPHLPKLEARIGSAFASDLRAALPSERLDYFRSLVEEELGRPFFATPYEGFLYFRFLDYLRWEEKQGKRTPTEIRRWLQGLSLRSPIAPKRPRDESSKVALLSVHAAKGLEFEAVFIADLSGRGGHDQDLYVIPSDSGVAVFRDVETGALKKRFSDSPTLESLKEEKKQIELDESKRLLYVAVTRAKRLLYVHTVAPKEKTGRNARSPYSWNDWIHLSLSAAAKRVPNARASCAAPLTESER